MVEQVAQDRRSLGHIGAGVDAKRRGRIGVAVADHRAAGDPLDDQAEQPVQVELLAGLAGGDGGAQVLPRAPFGGDLPVAWLGEQIPVAIDDPQRCRVREAELEVRADERQQPRFRRARPAIALPTTSSECPSP